jgi:putative copper resistance protein D
MEPLKMGGMQQVEETGFFSVFHVLIGARWIHFSALFVVFGASFFWIYMVGGRRAADHDRLRETLRATTILLRFAAPTAAISGVVWLAGILANMTDGFGSLADSATLRVFFCQTQFGLVAILRLVLLATAVLIVFLPWQNRAWHSALAIVGALLLIDQAWLGHAAEGGAGLYGAFMILVYCVHILSAGAWIGGLPPLIFAIAEQRRFNPRQACDGTLDLLSRYSVMAMIAVTLLVGGGVANAGFRVGFSFDKFFDADYGIVLATKAALVAVMLALAFFNRFIAMPRLRAASPVGVTQIAKLRASVTFELVLGVLVLGAAAVLGVTPPPQ